MPPTVFVLFVAGFWGASSYIQSVPVAGEFDDAKAEFGVWVALIGAVGGYALAASVCFMSWLVGVVHLFNRLRRTTVVSWVASVAVVGGTVFASLFVVGSGAEESIDTTLATQTRPIIVVVALCMAPGLVSLMALRSVATHESNWLERGSCRLRLLVRLRSELRRLVATLGAFLTVVVVATGMRRRALLALDADLNIPAEQVLLYGLVFAVLLALFFVAATSAIDSRAQSLIDEFARLPDPADDDLSEQLRRRNDLSALVGSGGSWRSFETTVIIAAPLLTALIGSATSG